MKGQTPASKRKSRKRGSRSRGHTTASSATQDDDENAILTGNDGSPQLDLTIEGEKNSGEKYDKEKGKERSNDTGGKKLEQETGKTTNEKLEQRLSKVRDPKMLPTPSSYAR